MCSPRLFLWKLDLGREGAVNWDADVITLPVGPCGKTATGQQRSETKHKRGQTTWICEPECAKSTGRVHQRVDFLSTGIYNTTSTT